MNRDFRTLLRGFLLVGGLVFFGLGVARGDLFNVGLGALAAVLGGFGLWWDYNRQSADHDE